MGPEHKQHEDAIDRVLGALRDAAPPAGMETRIAQRLAEQRVDTTVDASLWRSLFARLAMQGPWLRGAITGVAVASLAFGAFLLLTRPAYTPTHHESSMAQTGGGSSQRGATPQTVHATPVVRAEASAGQSSNAPCGDPALMHVHNPSAAPRDYRANRSEDRPLLRSASFAPSGPAPPAPLTAQERALLQLARTADPAALAALNPAAEQKADAEREAAFEKFFAPSPQLIAAEKAEEEATHSADGSSPQPTEVQN